MGMHTYATPLAPGRARLFFCLTRPAEGAPKAMARMLLLLNPPWMLWKSHLRQMEVLDGDNRFLHLQARSWAEGSGVRVWGLGASDWGFCTPWAALMQSVLARLGIQGVHCTGNAGKAAPTGRLGRWQGGSALVPPGHERWPCLCRIHLHSSAWAEPATACLHSPVSPASATPKAQADAAEHRRKVCLEPGGTCCRSTRPEKGQATWRGTTTPQPPAMALSMPCAGEPQHGKPRRIPCRKFGCHPVPLACVLNPHAQVHAVLPSRG